MSTQQNPKLITSPWRVVEVFVMFLMASTVGEFMGAMMGEPAQLTIAVMELAIGLLLSIPALSGKRWGWYAMGVYLIYYGLCTFALMVIKDTEAFNWMYMGPLCAYFAAGGLKMLLTKPPQPGADDNSAQ